MRIAAPIVTFVMVADGRYAGAQAMGIGDYAGCYLGMALDLLESLLAERPLLDEYVVVIADFPYVMQE